MLYSVCMNVVYLKKKKKKNISFAELQSQTI